MGIEQIEETLHSLFKGNSFLEEGAKYLIFAPSKRIRPLITLAAVEMLGGDPKSAVTAACAIELIHTYSLIHDDLPCMDNDDIRRGKPALHKVYDEATALLIGDFLLTYAFEVLANDALPSEKKIDLIKTLALHAGSNGMIGGQMLDWQKSPDKKEVDLKKTAALFVCCFQFATIITTSKENLTKLGETIGLLFQLADDIQDKEATSSLRMEQLSNEALELLKPHKSDTIKSLIEQIVFSCTSV